jgi:hypothetical protein
VFHGWGFRVISDIALAEPDCHLSDKRTGADGYVSTLRRIQSVFDRQRRNKK